MKKVIGVFVLLFIGVIGLFATHAEVDIETGSRLWQIIIDYAVPVIALVLGAWKVLDIAKISKPAGVVADYSEKMASALDGLGLILEGAGMNRFATIVKEASDPFDELGDVFAAIEKHTADGEFTKDEILNVLEEGKEVIVEGKDFHLKILKKQ